MKKELLFIGGTREIIKLENDFLGRSSFRLKFVETLAEAVGYLKRNSVDLIVVDLQLPDAQAEIVLQELAVFIDQGNLPAIAVSATVEPEFKIKCAEAGVKALLPKPLDLPKLVSEISHLLGAEIRQHQRFLVQIEIEGHDLFHGHRFWGTSEDVSISGILVQSKDDVAPGTKVNICFSLPKIGKRFNVEGEVVRVFNAESGCRQIGIKFAEKQKDLGTLKFDNI